MTIHTIVLPRVCGARQSAALIAAEVPENCTSVIVDAGGNTSAAQGYLDELVAQIAQERGLNMWFTHSRPRLTTYVMQAGALRGVGHLVIASDD